MVNTMLMAIHERTHEFGILRAIGMHKGWLLLMVMLESLGLALISAALGATLGVALVLGPLRQGIDMSASLPDGFDMVGLSHRPGAEHGSWRGRSGLRLRHDDRAGDAGRAGAVAGA